MPVAPRPDFGATVACLASGPSLTAEDAEAVRRSGLPTIVTNSTFRRAPWATALFGFDLRWWLAHIQEIESIGFKGERWAYAPGAAKLPGVRSLCGATWSHSFGNSGVSSIMLAADGGARRIILVGFDSKFAADGRKHWHDDHPGLTNCASLSKWPQQFARAAGILKRSGVDVVNCSRSTALDCFRRAPLEQTLTEWAK